MFKQLRKVIISIPLLSSGASYTMVVGIVNVLHMTFAIIMGRALSPAEFGVLNTFLVLQTLLVIPANALAGTVSRYTAYFDGQRALGAKQMLWRTYGWFALLASLISVVILAGSSQILLSFFHLESWFFISAITIFLVGVFGFSLLKGKLHGQMQFHFLGLCLLSEAGLKVGWGVMVLTLGWGLWGVLYAVPVSIVLSWLLMGLVRPVKQQVGAKRLARFVSTRAFYTVSVFSQIGFTVLLSLDVLLAKHFLSAEAAGQYGLLSFLGKVIFLGTGIIRELCLPYIAKRYGQGISTLPLFRWMVGVCSGLALVTVLVYQIAQGTWLQLAFPNLTTQTLSLLLSYSLSMTFLSMGAVIATYHMARGELGFGWLPLISAGLLLGLLGMEHSTLASFSTASLASNSVFLGLTVFSSRFLRRNVWWNTLWEDIKALVKDPRLERQGNQLYILVFNWRDTHHVWSGGAEVYLNELTKRWVAAGHHVTWFCGNDQLSLRNEVIKGVQIVRRGGFYTVYVWAFLYYIFKFRGRYDVIVDSENGVPFFTPLYVKETVVAVIHHVHQQFLLSQSLNQLGLPQRLLARIAAFLERSVMPVVYRHTHFVTVSPSTKREIVAHQLSVIPPTIVYNGVKPPKISASKSIFPSLLFVGRLKPYKRVAMLIQVAAVLKPTIPDLRVWIAGEGEDRAQLEALAKDLKVEHTVRFAGKVSEARKWQLYRQAWLFINPSSMEGWGITNIEANAAGTPVVGFNVIGVCDSVSDGYSGVLVQNNKLIDLQESIRSLLTQSQHRQVLGEQAREWAQRFSWDESAQRFMKVILKELEGHQQNWAVAGLALSNS